LDIAKKFAQEIEGLGHNGSMTSKTMVNSRALNFLVKIDFLVISSGLVDKSIKFVDSLEYIPSLPSSLVI
jgi:2-methylaconitate cis-trans-isomerase PrpF